MDILQDKLRAVITNHGKRIIAPKVIIASHYPFYEAHGLYFSRIYPERSYILATKISEKFPSGMYITAEDPTRSLRAQRNGDEELVLVGGEHHKTGQGKDMINHYLKLKDFAEQIFTVEDIPYHWSTQDYTTMDGKLHLVDTTCTHMGCELQWNSAEKSWDCPCHGSRFTIAGEIITGPALRKLAYTSKQKK